jgi:hypothetical protein
MLGARLNTMIDLSERRDGNSRLEKAIGILHYGGRLVRDGRGQIRMRNVG